jgi:hypothetical protein
VIALKTHLLIPGTCIVLLVAAIITAGCTLPSVGRVTAIPTPVPTVTSAPACGPTPRHGADLSCSTNAPQVCTMEYRTGDRCRQYASCNTTGGSCTLVTDSRFTACKACAERCQIQSGPDSLAALSCEEKC